MSNVTFFAFTSSANGTKFFCGRAVAASASFAGLIPFFASSSAANWSAQCAFRSASAFARSASASSILKCIETMLGVAFTHGRNFEYVLITISPSFLRCMPW